MPRKPGARRPVVLPLAAGLALSVGLPACSGKSADKGIEADMPPPDEPARNPPAQRHRTTLGLLRW